MSEVKVYLVGAGPGDAGLITVRAVELLKKADCVIYDGLVNPSVLSYAPAHAECISVRKRTGPAPATQDMIGRLLVRKAKQGMFVVRLKGGDPGIFGRVNEEAAALADAGIAFEIVPGITAGLAAAEYCGIFVSDRRFSSSVLFVTGHEAADKTQSSINYKLLADFDGTIVFYMAMGNLKEITSRLIECGRAKGTPVAVICNATLSGQRFLKSNLGDVAVRCEQEHIEPPAIVIIGDSADSDCRYNWFMHRPLSGKTIVLTRDRAGNEVFAARLLELGAEAVCFDTIEITDLTGKPDVENVLSGLGAYDWVIFTSANGVKVVCRALERKNLDARAFAGAKVGCVGPGTAGQLALFGIRADFEPTVFTTASLARQLDKAYPVNGKRILLLRSGIALATLADILINCGASVKDVAVYTVKPSQADPAGLISRLAAGTGKTCGDTDACGDTATCTNAKAVDFITFMSPSAVDAFIEKIPCEIIRHSSAGIVSIGPVTSQQIRRAGLNVDIEACRHTIDGLIEAMAQGNIA